jgi:hypothetical protein
MKQIRVGVALAVLSTLAPAAAAIPAFARRYGTGCAYCHEGFPKLNYEGQRFKERGFRMPGEAGFKPGEWLASVPITGRGWYNRFLLEDGDDIDTGYLKLITAGNLGGRLSYWLDDAFLITGGDDNFHHVKPTNAWARIELVGRERLYLKGGRIDLDLPFTQVRTPHLLPYDIYNTNSGYEQDTIGGYQDGAELGGSINEDWRWSAAVVKGRNGATDEAFSSDAGKFDADVFLHVKKRFDRNRVTAFGYFARDTLARSATVVFKNSYERYGVSGDFWIAKLNLYGVYMHGHDSNPYADPARPEGYHADQSFDGGFAQADWHLRDFLALTARLNIVNKNEFPQGGGKQTYAGLFPGIQVFLFRHGKLSFEYGFLNQARSSFGAFQAEVAF